jgi:hypothetical protein
MIHPDDYICPRCGLLCPTLTFFHRHYAKEHQPSDRLLFNSAQTPDPTSASNNRE